MDKLGKYCKIISGYAFKSNDLSEGTDIPVIKIGNISNGNDVIIDNSIQYVSKDFLSIDKKYHVVKGDVLISLTGSHINQPNSMVGRSCRNFSDTEFLLNQRAGKVIPNNNADKDYLYYLLNTESFKYSICNRAYGAANQANISPSDIECIKWNFPSLSMQRKIASILSAYDNLIENNNKRIKILEQMAENLYKEWFVRFRFPGHETTPFENGIPKGWSEEKLSVVFEVKYGKDHKNIEDGLIPIFGSGGIMRYGNKALCSEESVLIPRKGSLNNVMYYKGNFWTVDTMFYTKMKIKHCAKYTYFTLSKVDLEGLNSGASIPSMTTDILYHLKMIVPDESTLIAFDKQIDLLFAEKDSLELQNQNLIKQRDLLLPRLMSGKLAV